MPDIYVDTDVTPGGSGTSGDPYSTLHEAWEGEEAGIGAGETWNFFCAGSTADTSVVVIDGVFAQASGVTVNIHPWHTNFGASSDKDDGWNAGNGTVSASYYQSHQTSGADGIYLDFGSSGSNSNTINIEGIQVTISSATSGARLIGCNNGNVNDHVSVVACRLQANQTGGTNFPRGVRTDSNCFASVDVINCLLVYAGTAPVSFFNINKNHSQTFRFINNTCVNTSTGGEDTIDDAGSSNIVRAINNAIFHSVPTTTDVELDLQAGTKTVLTNATPVSGDRGGGFDITSGDFNSYSTDFRPAASQTNAWGTGGTTNGTNSNVPTTDILGDPRNTSGNTAIGCFAIIAGEGASGVTGTGAITSSIATTSGTGTRTVKGTSALTGSTATTSGTGTREVKGSSALTGSVAETSGTGTREVKGTAAITAPVATLAAEGDIGAPVTGTGDLTAPVATLSADGSREIKGTSALAGSVAETDATGSREIKGTADPTAPAATTNATGTRSISGTAALTGPVPELDASGDVAAGITGTGALTAPSATLAASGAREAKGTAALDAPVVTLDASGSREVKGTSDLDAPVATLDATGARAITGASALTGPTATTLASGFTGEAPAAETRQPGGWLPRRRIKPIIYVDEDGNPVDITAPVEEAIEAAPEAKQETIRKAVERVTEQTKTPTIKAVGRAIQRIDAAAFKRFYEAERQRADDDDVAAILLLAA